MFLCSIRISQNNILPGEVDIISIATEEETKDVKQM